MISVSFGMFTALWQNVANECRVATMQEGGEEKQRESERERHRKSERGGGSGLCSQ